MLSRLG